MIYTPCHDNDEWATVTDLQFEKSYTYGLGIHDYSQKKKFRDKYCGGDRYGKNAGGHVHGIGEVAAHGTANRLGLPWLPSLNTFKKADLGFDIEVRLMGQDNFGLRVRSDDNDSRRVVGPVIVNNRELERPYRMPGWIYAKDAKIKDYEIDPGNRGMPMYAVPQSELRPLRELFDIIAKEQNLDPLIADAIWDFNDPLK